MVLLDHVSLQLDLLDFQFLFRDLVLVVLLVGLVVLIQSAVALVIEVFIIESLQFEVTQFLLEIMHLNFSVIPIDNVLEFGNTFLELGVLTVDSGHDLVILILLVGVCLGVNLVVDVLEFLELVHLFRQSFLLGP